MWDEVTASNGVRGTETRAGAKREGAIDAPSAFFIHFDIQRASAFVCVVRAASSASAICCLRGDDAANCK